VTLDLFTVRSLLFLPASNPRAVAKAKASAADMVILDLEDAVKSEDKALARTAAVEAVAEPWPMPVAIRVNGSATQWHEHDIAAVAASAAPLAVLPRTGSALEARSARERLGKPMLAMIETAVGVIEAPAIAREVSALLAGTNDLSADLRLPPGAGRAPLQLSLQSTVLAARAAGIAVFDGVFNKLADPDGLRSECEEGRRFGFDGKSLIHPNQIEICNMVYSPGEAEIERAQKLIAASTGGAERFEDEMIEQMHVEAARRILERAKKTSTT
jgi:citrate lyase subunit beta/citryl-CoA lyase